MDKGWVKLHRQITDWEWWDDKNTFRVFMYLLLSANHEEKNWQGVLVTRGSIITSYENLSSKCSLTVQQVRTSINKLKSTNEITIRTTNKFSLIQITNYDKYQDDNGQDNKQSTNNQQTNNKQITTTKECKELKNINNTTNVVLDESNYKEEEKKEFGNEEINQMLEFLKKNFGVDDFRESKREQRIVGSHLVNLKKKYGIDVFRENIIKLSEDAFKRKNCNSLWFVYKELKSMPINSGLIKPIEQTRLVSINF